MPFHLAVDIGQALTTAATASGVQPPRVEQLGVEQASLPTALWLAADGSFVVGSTAVRRADADPTRFADRFVRKLVTGHAQIVGGAAYAPSQLCALVLGDVVAAVSRAHGGHPERMVITHPASWPPSATAALRHAGVSAGVGSSLMLEATTAVAAGIHAVSPFEIGDAVAVVLLCAGGLDTAVVQLTADGLCRMGEAIGLGGLGGEECDEAVYRLVRERLGVVDPADVDDEMWIESMTRLRNEAHRVAVTLRTDSSAVVTAWLPTGKRQLTVTADEFAVLVAPMIDEWSRAVWRAVRGSGVPPQSLRRLVVAGDASRLPGVVEAISAQLGLPGQIVDAPSQAVALGAAHWARGEPSEAPAIEPAAQPPATAGTLLPTAPPAVARPSALPSPSPPSKVDSATVDVADVCAGVVELAIRHGRDDLVARLDERVGDRSTTTLRVLIAGDFKQGKSTLVNALIGSSTCPSDPDFATCVPTTVRHGTQPSATIFRESDDSSAVGETVDPSQIGRWVSETEGADLDRDRVRSCEVGLPVEWLSTGIELVDMPGYGGIDAMAGARLMAELRQAHAVLFVTDASQEITAPEMDLLKTAVRQCPRVAIVLSKIDAYVDWRTISDVDAGHLRREKLDLAILPVSALHHLAGLSPRAATGPDDGGIGALVDYVTGPLATEVAASSAKETLGEVSSALNQLRSVLAVELEAHDPTQQARVVNDLRQTMRELTDMRLDSAAWHRFLRDRCDDLRATTLERLEASLGHLRSEAEAIIADHDPATIWQEFQNWMHVRAAAAVSDLYTELVTEAESLEQALLYKLSADHSVPGLMGNAPAKLVPSLDVAALDSGFGDRATNVAVESSWSAAEPLLGIGGFIPGFGPVSLAVAAVAGLVFGRRALRERRSQALEARRQQATDHLVQYLSDVQRAVLKPGDRYLSQLYRALRDGVLRRTDELERSTSEALGRSVAAAAAPESERIERRLHLAEELAAADGLRVRIAKLTKGR